MSIVNYRNMSISDMQIRKTNISDNRPANGTQSGNGLNPKSILFVSQHSARIHQTHLSYFLHTNHRVECGFINVLQLHPRPFFFGYVVGYGWSRTRVAGPPFPIVFTQYRDSLNHSWSPLQEAEARQIHFHSRRENLLSRHGSNDSFLHHSSFPAVHCCRHSADPHVPG